MPLTRYEPRTWLLSNGETVTEPQLEQTSTGRKIRVQGEKESFYSSDLDRMLTEAVASIATARSTSILTEITYARGHERSALGFDTAETKAELHLIHKSAEDRRATICWWRFKHPGMAYEVVLYVTLANGAGGRQILKSGLVMPELANHDSVMAVHIQDHLFSGFVERVPTPYYWREFIRDAESTWRVDLLGKKDLPHPRAAVVALLEAVREFEKYETITIPDARKIEYTSLVEPGWMELEIYETNVNSSFLSDLTEYLDAAPTVEHAAELYEELLGVLKATGIHVAALAKNDFLAALIAGKNESLSVAIKGLAEENNQFDENHKLSMHLPTGTFVVECSHQNVDPNQVAEKWEEAKLIAQMTGEEPELLAYARRFAHENVRRRTKTILNERS